MDRNNEIYLQSLIDLGLKENEAKVYLATLKLGQAGVTAIADEASVQRTFVYDILDELKAKSLVSEVEIRHMLRYSAASIERFSEIQKKKFASFQALVPDFKAMEKSVGDRPRVRFFEGPEGIKTALYDTLSQPKGSQILGYSTGEGFYETEQEFAYKYLKDRVKYDIHIRTIVPDVATNRVYLAHDKEQLRQTVLISADKFPFTNEINIYQNKMLIVSLRGEILAVIIESESIAKTQRSIFELAWLGAKSVSSIK
jgi:sugar-specific transcriptional regulator TrmB